MQLIITVRFKMLNAREAKSSKNKGTKKYKKKTAPIVKMRTNIFRYRF